MGVIAGSSVDSIGCGGGGGGGDSFRPFSLAGGGDELKHVVRIEAMVVFFGGHWQLGELFTVKVKYYSSYVGETRRC